MWMMVAPTPVARSTRTETNATFENRGTHTERPATRRPAGSLAQHQQPDQAAQPDRPRDQVQPVEREREPARGGLAACPASPGTSSAEPAATSAPVRARISAMSGARAAGGRPRARSQPRPEEGHADLDIDIRAPERGYPEQGHKLADIEQRAQRVDRGGDVQVDGIATRLTAAMTQRRSSRRAGSSPRPAPRAAARSASETRRGRSRSSPTGTCPARHQQVRRRRRLGDAGDRECGWGPGSGPTAKVYPPWTGWPSTEIARQ